MSEDGQNSGQKFGEKYAQPPETTPEDDAILDKIWDTMGNGTLPAPQEPPPPKDLDAADVPNADAQEEACKSLGYQEGSDEWDDFNAGWWFAMRHTPAPPTETEAFKQGHAAYRP